MKKIAAFIAIIHKTMSCWIEIESRNDNRKSVIVSPNEFRKSKRLDTTARLSFAWLTARGCRCRCGCRWWIGWRSRRTGVFPTETKETSEKYYLLFHRLLWLLLFRSWGLLLLLWLLLLLLRLMMMRVIGFGRWSSYTQRTSRVVCLAQVTVVVIATEFGWWVCWSSYRCRTTASSSVTIGTIVARGTSTPDFFFINSRYRKRNIDQ